MTHCHPISTETTLKCENAGNDTFANQDIDMRFPNKCHYEISAQYFTRNSMTKYKKNS